MRIEKRPCHLCGAEKEHPKTCPACRGKGFFEVISFADENGRNEELEAYYATPGRNSGD